MVAEIYKNLGCDVRFEQGAPPTGHGTPRGSVSPPAISGGAAVLGATQFYLLTNFAVWLGGDGATYPKTVAGLLQCYVAGLPFYRNMLLGNLLYSGLFFGLYALALRGAERRKAEQPA